MNSARHPRPQKRALPHPGLLRSRLVPSDCIWEIRLETSFLGVFRFSLFYLELGAVVASVDTELGALAVFGFIRKYPWNFPISKGSPWPARAGGAEVFLLCLRLPNPLWRTQGDFCPIPIALLAPQPYVSSLMPMTLRIKQGIYLHLPEFDI